VFAFEQVYSTSCGQDHWLLGLQYIFKACKEPVITHVDMQGDSLVTVSISTQGMQDKYNSSDPVQRAELQRSLEAAAYTFAQVQCTACAEIAGTVPFNATNLWNAALLHGEGPEVYCRSCGATIMPWVV
jgi:hypothetical protein